MDSINRIYNNDLCLVCRDEYVKNRKNDCLLLKCGHIFHRDCVETWIKEHENCPACRGKTFVPILIKDIIAETVNQGIDGVKKSGKYVALTISTIAIYFLMLGTLNYLFPGRWPTTDEEVDEFINEHGVLLDLRKPENLFYLGLGITATMGMAIGIGGVSLMVKSLKQPRNQPPEVAKVINYIPPNE